MSGPYVDTSVLLKLVLDEPLSEPALRLVQERRTRVLYTRLIEVEAENILHAKRCRKEISGRELNACRALIGSLLDDGRLVRPQLALDGVVTEALSLIPGVVSATGCRTLDMLHIASARLLECDELVTCDHRQAQAGTTAGLHVTLLKP